MDGRGASELVGSNGRSETESWTYEFLQPVKKAADNFRDLQESAKYIALVKLFTRKGLNAPSSLVFIKESISFTPNDVL
jgi:hypothetical protein